MTPASSAPTPQSDFVARLGELGYVEGRNLKIERRPAAGNLNRLNEYAAELVHLKVDLIVALATPAAQATRKATTSVPIVFIAVVDPVGAGLVANLARPGGNATGLSMLSAALSGKRLELVREIVPGLERVVVLGNPDNDSNRIQLAEVESAARKFSVQTRYLEARTGEEIGKVLNSTIRDRGSALIVLDDPLLVVEAKRIASLAAKYRLPAVYGFRESTEAGGLISYGMSLPDQFWRAAVYIDRILKGAKPADLPVEQPTKFELIINLESAKKIGLTIPRSVLLRADRVIE